MYRHNITYSLRRNMFSHDRYTASCDCGWFRIEGSRSDIEFQSLTHMKANRMSSMPLPDGLSLETYLSLQKALVEILSAS
jgi:hypothetical protein